MLKRILVPLDGSACAKRAFDYALRLARAEGAMLEICSVVDPVSIIGRAPVEPLADAHVALAKIEADKHVAQAIESAAGEAIAVEGHVEYGEPAAAIVRHAIEGGADAIVMGANGFSGIKRLFMGRVAETVLRTSPCPVVIVRGSVSSEIAEDRPHIVDAGEPVYALRLIEVVPEDFERLYGEIATFLDGPGLALPGAIDAELFGSEDSRRIAIVMHYRSGEDWARAQWDERLGELLEEIATNSQILDFSLYRRDRFRKARQPVS